MEKRGQTTIFIVAGLIIAVVVGFSVYLSGSIGEEASQVQASEVATLPVDLQQAGAEIESCIGDVGEFALAELGSKGGYLTLPAGIDAVRYAGSDVAYLYDGGDINIPSIDAIELDLAQFVKSNVVDCTSGVSVSAQGGEVEDVRVTVQDENVNFFVEWPITFARGDVRSRISKFNTDVDVRLKEVHGVVVSLLEEQELADGSVCISCIVEEGNGKDFGIDLYFEDNTTIYGISDPDSDVGDAPYEFYLATR